MQIQLGSFSFAAAAGGAEYSEARRRSTRRWVERRRHGRPPALEDLGRGAGALELSGTIWVKTAADLGALDALRVAGGLGAAAGEPPGSLPLPLFSGSDSATSSVRVWHGWWVIQRMTERRRMLRVDGTPTRIDFSLSLIEHADPAPEP